MLTKIEVDGISYYELGPPNWPHMHPRELLLGRGDYEEEQIEYWRERSEWLSSGKKGPEPIHWREKVGDPHAGKPVWIDVTGTVTGKLFFPSGYYMTWCPNTIYELILNCPPVVKSTDAAFSQGTTSIAMKDIRRGLRRMFRKTYKEVDPLSKLAKKRSRGQIGPEENWELACKSFDNAVEILSHWCLCDYSFDQGVWIPLVVKYADLSGDWDEQVQQLQTREKFKFKTTNPFYQKKERQREPETAPVKSKWKRRKS